VSLASARAGNVIGGGDWAEGRLVPDVLQAFSRGESAKIRNPHAIRPWQHVLEPLRGYLDLAERLYTEGNTFAEAFNFGPRNEDSQTVESVVSRLATKWGGGATWAIDSNIHPHEAISLQLDISKAARHLAWRPALNLDVAIQLTVDWARACNHSQDMREFTKSQINDYLASI
jgi:CDP-glucose 4,6-dehydratase